jgi:hypothetical protein
MAQALRSRAVAQLIPVQVPLSPAGLGELREHGHGFMQPAGLGEQFLK